MLLVKKRKERRGILWSLCSCCHQNLV